MWFPSVKTLTNTLQKLTAFPMPTVVFFLFFIIVDLQCCVNFCSTANNKIILCSTGNYSQYPRVIHNGKEHEKEWIYVCMRAKLLQWCLTLCNPMDFSPPGSSIHGILQARKLEWAAKPSSRAFSQLPHLIMSPASASGFFTTSPTWEALDMCIIHCNF